MSCKEYQRGAPLTAHRWRQSGIDGRLRCKVCRCILSDEGIGLLAIRLQFERDELLAYAEEKERRRG